MNLSYEFELKGDLKVALKALDLLGKVERNIVKIAGKKIDFDKVFTGARSLEAFNNSLQQSTDALLGFINKSASLSDVSAIVQKNTGLTAIEMQALKASIDQLDTRTATQDLLKMASVGGKLGVAKQDLQGFVRVIDKATVALGDEFGNDAERVATVLGKIRGQFKEFEGQSAESALSSIASAINYLGKQGANSAPVVAEFTQRVSTLGLSLAQSAGLGASLEELGLSAEIASGGLSAIMGLAATESSKFAQHLGLSQQAFEDLMNSNPNQVVLDLAKSFEQASDTQIAQQLKALGVSSQESVRVMKLLSTNTDLVSARQVAAAEQVRKKTDLDKENKDMQGTLAGQLARVQKRFEAYTVGVGNVLAPYAGLIQSTAFLSMGISSLIPLLGLARGAVLVLAQGLLRYGLGLTAVNGKLVFTRTSLLGVILQTGRWATLLLVQGVKSLALFAGRLTLLAITALPALIASFGGASLAAGMFNAVLSMNPIGVIVVGLGALVAGLIAAYYKFESFRNLVDSAGKVIMSVFRGIAKGATALFEAVRGVLVAMGLLSEQADKALAKTDKARRYTNERGVGKGVYAQQLERDKAAASRKGLGNLLAVNTLPKLPSTGAGALNNQVNQGLNQVSGGGSRPTTINIDFNSLVEQFTVYTSQGIAADDIEQRIKEVLLRVVNGANQIAGV